MRKLNGGDGITPAWAGKRQNPWPSCPSCQDHPRVGGEKWKLANLLESAMGSPPRGRGKDRDADQRHDR